MQNFNRSSNNPAGRQILEKPLNRMRARSKASLLRVVAVLAALGVLAIAYQRDTRRTEPDTAREVYLGLMPEVAEQLMRYPFMGNIFDKQPLHGVGDYLYASLIPLGLTPQTLEQLRVACHQAAVATIPKDERPYSITPGYWNDWSRLAGPVRYESLAASVRKVVLTHAEFRKIKKKGGGRPTWRT